MEREGNEPATGGGVSVRPPRENLIRAITPGVELRTDDGAAMPTLFGHFAVFNRWTEISSWFEGNFMERFVPGAFTKTFKESRDRIRVLFQHGSDPQIGDKPLGAIKILREEDAGAYYETPLLDTAYNRELLPGLEAGLYGASFRFQVVKEEIEEEPKPSKHNPRGLPERTVKEAKVLEFGPVTFPAYADATASVRSLTDRFLVGQVLDRGDSTPDQIRALIEALNREPTRTGVTPDDNQEPEGDEPTTPDSEPETDDASTTPASEPEPAEATTPNPPARARRFRTRDEYEEWLAWNCRT